MKSSIVRFSVVKGISVWYSSRFDSLTENKVSTKRRIKMESVKELTSEVLGQFEEELVASFDEDQLISHKWLKEKFGLPKLSFENYDKNVDAYIEAIQLQQFTYMAMVDKLREDLLKNKQYCLRNVWGNGYVIVPSNEQANYGYDQMMSDIKKALKQGSDIINNVRPLPMVEQSKYYDTLAKLAKVRDVFANLK